MKNRLIFRVLGALASALIIASVFIPFVSVTGYSQSLWQTHNAVGTIYLPIMIIVFGAVGVLVFSTGFKTELAYASAGGLLFFLIMQTIPIINQNLFNTLGVGYYCLVAGTFLIILMAFICGLKVKQKIIKEKTEIKKEVSMIEQIDKLYGEQSIDNSSNENNPLENIIQPISAGTPISIPQTNNSIGLQNIPLNSLNFNEEKVENIPISNPSNLQQVNNVQVNPVLAEFNIPSIDTSDKPSETSINPVVSEFSVPTMNTSNNVAEQIVNPVVSEFTQSSSNSSVGISNNNIVNQPNSFEQSNQGAFSNFNALNDDKKIDVVQNTSSSNSNLDIFG